MNWQELVPELKKYLTEFGDSHHFCNYNINCGILDL